MQAPTLSPLEVGARAMLPPARPPVATWAENRMRFTDVDAAPRYVLEKSPYSKTVFEWWLDRAVEEIYLIWPTQSGKTALLATLISYVVENDPGPLLFAQSDEDPTKGFVKDRLAPTIKKTFPDLPTRWNLDTGSYLGGMHVWVAWGSSEPRLRSWPRRYIFGDETSAWRESRHLAWERTKQFAYNRKGLYATTPTFENENSWITATNAFQLYRWWVPCPHCKEFQVLEFKALKFDHCKTPTGWDLDRVSRETYYPCQHCGAVLTDRDRNRMIQAGEARTEYDTRSSRRKSLRITCMDVPAISWGESARKFLESKDDPEDLRNFVNSWLAEPWTDNRQGIRAAEVMARTMDISAGVCPKNTVLLGAGVDVQRGHVYATVRAKLDDGRSVLIWCGHYDGRPAGQTKNLGEEEQVLSTARALERLWNEVLGQGFTWQDSSERLAVRFVAVDSGDGRTQKAVYDFARKHRGTVYAVKGSGEKGPLYTTSAIDKDSRGFALPGSLMLHKINTGHYRDVIVEAYRHSLSEKGAWLVARGTPDEYGAAFECWKSVEVETRDKNGLIKRRAREWRQVSTQDHYLDAEIYYEAIADNGRGLGLRKMNAAGSAPQQTRVKYGVVGRSFGGESLGVD